MAVPFYLKRPDDKIKSSFLAKPGDAWNTYENPNTYNSSKLVSDASFDRGNKQAALAEHFARNMELIEASRPTPKKQLSSWKNSIDYSKGYDEEIENKYRNEHDYLGLADYLSHFRMDDAMQQRAYDNEIAQIRRYGRQYNAIHDNATVEQSFGISFLEAFNNGDIDTLEEDNPYKKQYNSVVSRLGRGGTWLFADYATDDYRVDNNDGPEAATISVTFNNKKTNYSWFLGIDALAKDNDDEKQFIKFKEDTGYDLADVKKLIGDKAITVKDGVVTINVPKSNLKGIEFLTKVRDWANDTGRNSTDVYYASYDTEGNLVTKDSDYIGVDIDNLGNIIKRANRDKVDVEESIGSGQQIVSTTVLPYMNEYQMRLNNLRNAGLISEDDYAKRIKNDNEIYANLLDATAFSQLDVYTDRYNKENGDDSETLHQITDNIEKGRIKDYIRNAIREDRIKWRVGISGGEYGTYLTVSPEDVKGDILDDYEDARTGATFFIPGLFTESEQNAFNASTQGKTVAEINSMQRYGYEYTFQNGNVLSDVGNDSAKLYDKNTDTYRYIGREEAHDLLHEDIIIDDGSRTIRNRAFNIDGTPRQGYNPSIDAKKIAIAAANELYAGNPIDINDIPAWNPSKEDIAKRNAEGNIDRDYKVSRAYEIYSQLMGNIYKLLNSNNK